MEMCINFNCSNETMFRFVVKNEVCTFWKKKRWGMHPLFSQQIICSSFLVLIQKHFVSSKHKASL